MAGTVQQLPAAKTGQALSVSLLGPPQVARAGIAVELPRRQLRALFYRLAAELQPVAHEQLYLLLWPDIADTVARRHLTVLLNQLRQVLPSPALIRTHRDAILLDPALIQVDTVALMDALTHAAQFGELEPVAAAVKLYTGPFLDGFSLPTSGAFDAWAAQERQTWERRYLDALATLVDGYAARGAYSEAIAAAQRALAVDDMAEEMHRQLITLYATSGDRSAALRQFERCVLILERELGVSPLPETRSVYEAVRDGKAPLGKASEEPAPQIALFALQPPQSIAAQLGPSKERQGKKSISLPLAPSPLIGRQEEVAAIGSLLRDPAMRLITLLGPGGSGKTRLALQAAWDVSERFADGAIFVALAPLRDPGLVLLAIGQACGLAQSTPEALTEYLSTKDLLLVLDNCEHLLAAAPGLATLLAAAPALRLLVTSRAALNLHGEYIFPVAPLPLPELVRLPPLAKLAEVPSVALLLARTQALNPRFRLTAENCAEVAAICVRLDGLPLAIELAAARLKLLAPRDLLRRLERRLTTLTHGSRDLPERQQTLRATIEWSYRLLDIDEQIWFERCSVFAGAWTVAAVEALDQLLSWKAAKQPADLGRATAILDVLAALVDKSLIQVHATDSGETRFSMLETIREFAAEQLHQRGAVSPVAQAHADYYLNLVDPWDMNAKSWLTDIERELDNLRAALRWFLDRADGTEAALRLSRVLGRFWYWRDWVSEGRWWLEQAVVKSEAVRSEARAHLLNGAALMAVVQGDAKRAIELNEANLKLCQDLHLRKEEASALNNLGTLYVRHGDFARATAYFEEGLEVARQTDDAGVLGTAYYMLAGTLIDGGRDIARGLTLFEECLKISRRHQLRVHESMTLSFLGIAYALTGNLTRAAELLPEALRLQRELNATMSISWSLLYNGILAYLQAEYAAAERFFIESLATVPQGGAQYIVPPSLEGIAAVAAIRQHPEEAARLLGAADALREATVNHHSPTEQPLYDRISDSVRSQLTESAFQVHWQSGRNLSTEQAIAEVHRLSKMHTSTR